MSHYDPVNDNRAPVGPDRRQALRRRVLLTGKIVYPHNSLSADCTIRDLSDAGARISAAPEAISGDPFLIVVKDAVIHEAKTAWRNSAHAGLHFKRTVSLTGETPLHLRHAQGLWVELMPR